MFFKFIEYLWALPIYIRQKLLYPSLSDGSMFRRVYPSAVGELGSNMSRCGDKTARLYEQSASKWWMRLFFLGGLGWFLLFAPTLSFAAIVNLAGTNLCSFPNLLHPNNFDFYDQRGCDDYNGLQRIVLVGFHLPNKYGYIASFLVFMINILWLWIHLLNSIWFKIYYEKNQP